MHCECRGSPDRMGRANNVQWPTAGIKYNISLAQSAALLTATQMSSTHHAHSKGATISVDIYNICMLIK